MRTTRPANDFAPPARTDHLRNILAIAGVLAAALVAGLAYLFVPHVGAVGPVVAQEQPAQPPADNANEPAASYSGEGSLKVCNQTGNPVSIALGFKSAKGWQSEGWWVAPAGECESVYTGKLDARYYYIFAADDIGGGVWDGTNYMCTRDETFTISGVEDCLARGYERTGFFEVDTQNKANWTLQLTEGEVAGGEGTGSDDTPVEGDLPSGDEGDPGAADDPITDEGANTE